MSKNKELWRKVRRPSLYGYERTDYYFKDDTALRQIGRFLFGEYRLVAGKWCDCGLRFANLGAYMEGHAL